MQRGLRDLASSKASNPKLPTYDEIILRRDRYIARRINETLREGETGLLFMGAIHRTSEMLPPDIRISYLLPR